MYERVLPSDERAFESNHVAQRMVIASSQGLYPAPVEILEACGQLTQLFDNAAQYDHFCADALKLRRTPLYRPALRHVQSRA